MNVILLGETKPYGVLEADSEVPGTFTEHDIDFLQGVAHLLGLALSRRATVDELRQLNETPREPGGGRGCRQRGMSAGAVCQGAGSNPRRALRRPGVLPLGGVLLGW